MSSSDKPLMGRTVALPETRELNLLAEMVETKGARVIRCPLVAILDAPDSGPIEVWLHELVSGQFDDLVLMTGEGLRRLLGFADRAGMRDAVVGALAQLRRITRGPKPVKALREIGLASDLPAEQPTTDGVIATLAKHDLKSRRVAVQLYNQEPNPKLTDFLERAGATVRTVGPYVYAPASDADRVVDLVQRLAAGEVDVIAFTSASQVDRLFDVARKRGREHALREGFDRTRIAAVGPVVAETLKGYSVRVDIAPDKSFSMRPMVNAIVDALAASE